MVGFLDDTARLSRSVARLREKYPVLQKTLNELRVVFDKDAAGEGHAEYLPSWEMGEKGNNKYRGTTTIALNPMYRNRQDQELDAVILGDSLHHLREHDPEWKKLWNNYSKVVSKDENILKRQEGRSQYLKDNGYSVPDNLDQFLEQSAHDEVIRAYVLQDVEGNAAYQQFKQEETERPFFWSDKYKPLLEPFREYIFNKNFLTTTNKE